MLNPFQELLCWNILNLTAWNGMAGTFVTCHSIAVDFSAVGNAAVTCITF